VSPAWRQVRHLFKEEVSLSFKLNANLRNQRVVRTRAGFTFHSLTGLESLLQSAGAELTLTTAGLFFSTNFKLAGNPMLVFAIFRHLTAPFSSFERHFARQV